MYIVGLDAKGVMRKPITLEPEKTVLDARNTLLKYGITRVVVAKKRRALGIVTEKDLARIIYQQEPSRQLDEIRLDEVMSTPVVSVKEDTDLRECARVMLAKQTSSLLVVDGKKALVGIFTKTDLAGAYVEYYSMEHKVREFMTKKVMTVAPDEPIHSALLLMSGAGISRVVVTAGNRTVGIITGRDLLPLGAVASRYRRKTAYERPFIPSGIKAAMLASDVMTKDPITTAPGSDLADAAYIMIRNGISGLPVVQRSKGLVGIITKTDVARALASHT